MVPQISEREFRALPLRVHQFLADVPLHDVWAVDLPGARAGVTLDEFLRRTGDRLFTPSPAVRALLEIRWFVGRLLGWDRDHTASNSSSESAERTFAERLTPEDRARSLATPGTCDGPFCIVYRFENEQLGEVLNRTVHAAALSALQETPNAYRFYFAVYVRNVSRLTPLYMTLIDPFRKVIVYPSLLRSVRRNWARTIAAT